MFRSSGLSLNKTNFQISLAKSAAERPQLAVVGWLFWPLYLAAWLSCFINN